MKCKSTMGVVIFIKRRARPASLSTAAMLGAVTLVCLLLLLTSMALKVVAAPRQSSLRAVFVDAALRLVDQQGRPSIANEVEGEKKSKPEKSGGSTNSRKRTEDTRVSHRKSNAASRQPATLDVTFTTGVAGAEIFVQSTSGKLQLLSKAGADGRAVAKMPRGVYSITASRAGYQAIRQQVDIHAGSTSFVFNLTGRPLAVDGGSSTQPATADEVINRYLDPKQTDHVNANDWQLVQSQANASFAQNPNDPRTRAQSLFAQGQLAYLRGDYAAALVAFNNSALALPSSGLAFYGLGNAYLATNQLAEAMRAYERANQLSGGIAMAYKGIGDALSRQGKSRDALTYYERAKALGYSSNSISLSTALNLMKRERWAEALKELLELSKSQASSELFIYIGDCYYEMKQPLSAAPAYRKATELNPKSALAFAKYGEVMFEAREYAAAMESLERALALDPAGGSINRARVRKMADQAALKLRNMK